MLEPIEIIAIEGRTPEGNGVSRPFRCIGEDDAEYFVKLKNTGWNHLVKVKRIARRLAHEMELPAAVTCNSRIWAWRRRRLDRCLCEPGLQKVDR